MATIIKGVLIAGVAVLALSACKQENNYPATVATTEATAIVPVPVPAATVAVPVPGPTNTMIVPVPGPTVTATPEAGETVPKN